MRQIFNFKTYLTFLSRNRVYALINVFGFSVSLMFVVLIALYTLQEYGIDQHHTKGDRICVVATRFADDGEYITSSNHGFQKYMRSRYPEIESSCAITFEKSTRLMHPDGSVIMANMLFADSTFYNLFDFQLLAGDRDKALDDRQACIVTPELARQLFGAQSPIGQTVTFTTQFGGDVKVHVTGVMDKMRQTSLKQPDIIVRFEQMANVNSDVYPKMNNYGMTEVYYLLKPGTSLKPKEKDIFDYFKTFSFMFSNEDYGATIEVMPFRDIYFSGAESVASTSGDLTLVRILLAIGLVVLLFSVTNYINLTTAQAGQRAHEMATRRLLGSQRSDIIMRLISESMMLTAMSFALGLLLAWLCLPYAEALIDAKLDTSLLLSPAFLALLLGVLLLVGVLSGIIPAVVISRAKPIDVVRGTFRRQTKMILSKVFITFQSVFTIGVVATALIMFMQVRYMVNAPLGYDYENLMDIHTPGSEEQVKTFAQEVRKLPGVKAASRTRGSFIRGGNNNSGTYKGKTISIQRFYGERDFFEVHGIKPVKDYHRGDISGAYVSSNLFQMYSLEEDARSFHAYGDGNLEDTDEILGVLPDLHLSTITEQYHNGKAIVVYIWPYFKYYNCTTIKLNGNDAETVSEIRRIYKNVFKTELDGESPFVTDMIAENYKKERSLAAVVLVFAVIMVIISLLGLIAMSMYFIRQRRKEIAVRKVFGSTNRQIRLRLLRTFLCYVAIAFVIAAPIVWHFMGDWLSGYSYRISAWPWIVVSGVFCLLTSFAAVFVQSHVASNENPIRHIKDNG
ncbi:MAG: ABC transporter permease [Prevotella sp.]|nr:ABC transporter permease [Prevotella sp.]